MIFFSKINVSGVKQWIKKKLGKDSFVFLFFLFLAFLFWLLNELNKESVADISVPVQYENFFKDRILVNDVPDHITLKVQAPGYTLLKYKLSPRLVPVTLDLKSYLIHQKENSTVYYAVTRDLQGRFKRRFSGEMSIIEIQPDTLFFRFDVLKSRRVPVRLNVSYTLEKQYMVSGEVSASPDTVTVTGPLSVIDTLKGVHTEVRKYQNLKKAVSETIELITSDGLNYSSDEVILTIPVEQFTEATLKIPIEVSNLPDSLIMRTFPGQVTINCMVTLGRYENLSPRLFRVEVDYSQIKKNIGNQLKVNIGSSPDYVQSVKVKPAYVDFIIERK